MLPTRNESIRSSEFFCALKGEGGVDAVYLSLLPLGPRDLRKFAIGRIVDRQRELTPLRAVSDGDGSFDLVLVLLQITHKWVLLQFINICSTMGKETNVSG